MQVELREHPGRVLAQDGVRVQDPVPRHPHIGGALRQARGMLEIVTYGDSTE